MRGEPHRHRLPPKKRCHGKHGTGSASFTAAEPVPGIRIGRPEHREIPRTWSGECLKLSNLLRSPPVFNGHCENLMTRSYRISGIAAPILVSGST